jgi:hypothetical protein
MLSRRNLLFYSLLAGIAGPARAQNFPGALIRIIVPAIG